MSNSAQSSMSSTAHSASASASSSSHRWLAYDAANESENMDIEPGNCATMHVTWSQSQHQQDEKVELQLDAQSAFAASSSASSSSSLSNCIATASSTKSSLPSRTLLFHRAPQSTGSSDQLNISHTVHFLPREYYHELPEFLSTEQRTRIQVACHDQIVKLQAQLFSSSQVDPSIAASSSSLHAMDPYARFRFVWIACRDGLFARKSISDGASSVPFSSSSSEQKDQYYNLYAPITTHDQRTFHQRVVERIKRRYAATSRVLKADAGTATTAIESSQHDSYLHALSSSTGLLPSTPFSCDISNPTAMINEVLHAQVHALMCIEMEGAWDMREWKLKDGKTAEEFESAFLSSFHHCCQTLLALLHSHYTHHYLSAITFLHRSLRELLPILLLREVWSSCLRVNVTERIVQEGVYEMIFKSNKQKKYLPSLQHRHDFLSFYIRLIEEEKEIEVMTELLETMKQMKDELARGGVNGSGAEHANALTSYWSVEYPSDGVSMDVSSSSSSASSSLTSTSTSTCTLRLSSGFSSTTGCSLWPAAMMMCEFILTRKEVFRGKRVLELGVGVGMTSLLLSRLGASCVMCSDCDADALLNLKHNLEINDVVIASYHPTHDDVKKAIAATAAISSTSSFTPPSIYPSGVHLLHLDWCDTSPSRAQLLAHAAPDIIIACDTIYLPELHQAQGEVVKEVLMAAVSGLSSSSSTSPRRAYFSQMCRNPDTFSHYLKAFSSPLSLNLRSQCLTKELHAYLPKIFAYEREGIEMHEWM